MVKSDTIRSIENNNNPGIKHEIALFRCLLTELGKVEQIDRMQIGQIDRAIDTRNDATAIRQIIAKTDISRILRELGSRGLTLIDCSFETQNDELGPSDIVMHTEKGSSRQMIGISVKDSNTCTLNVTGRRFITESQTMALKNELAAHTRLYINDMKARYGHASNWFRQRKTSPVTDKYIDLIREAVIANWPIISDKAGLLDELYQARSPIEYWVYKYNGDSHILNIIPFRINPEDADKVVLEKLRTSYVGFYLDGKMIGKMQVKFNNGFIEKCTGTTPGFTVDGIRMAYGRPFTSWNFSTVK